MPNPFPTSTQVLWATVQSCVVLPIATCHNRTYTVASKILAAEIWSLGKQKGNPTHLPPLRFCSSPQGSTLNLNQCCGQGLQGGVYTWGLLTPMAPERVPEKAAKTIRYRIHSNGFHRAGEGKIHEQREARFHVESKRQSSKQNKPKLNQAQASILKSQGSGFSCGSRQELTVLGAPSIRSHRATQNYPPAQRNSALGKRMSKREKCESTLARNSCEKSLQLCLSHAHCCRCNEGCLG